MNVTSQCITLLLPQLTFEKKKEIFQPSRLLFKGCSVVLILLANNKLHPKSLNLPLFLFSHFRPL